MRKQLHVAYRQPLLWFFLSFTCVFTFQNCANNFKSASEESIEAAQSVNQKYTITTSSSQAGVSSKSSQTFAFATTGHDSEIASYLCQLDQAAPVVCTSPYLLSGLSELHHTLMIQGKNSSGVTIATGVYTFIVDMTPPVLTLTQTPGAFTGAAAATLAFSAVDALTDVQAIKCSIDGGTMQTVSNPFTTAALANGAHSASCQTSDSAGNASNVVTAAWTTSLLAPVITLDKTLPAFSPATNILKFTTSSSTQSAVSTACSLDGVAFSACATGQTYSGLAAGKHSLTVQATDVLNRVTTAVYTWTVDLTPPVVRITTVAQKYSNLQTYPVAFAVDDGTGSGAGPCQCAVGASATTLGTYVSCTSPYTLNGATEGTFFASIQCMDAVGNQSAPSTYQITFDRTPPAFSYTSDVVSLSANQTATFNFSAVEAVSNPVRFQTQLDSAAFVDSPAQLVLTKLADGKHTLVMKALDDAGNASPTQSISWTVDTQPPTLPTGLTYQSLDSDEITVLWTASTDAGSGVDHYEFKVGTTDGASDLFTTTTSVATSFQLPYSATAKGSPVTYPFEGRVSYISVRAIDKMGNASAWASSGPTNPDLYDQDFPYHIGCGFYNACDVTKLDTSTGNLALGKATGTPYTLIAPGEVIRLESVFTADLMTDLIEKSPGTLSTVCSLGGANFNCDLIKGQAIPNLTTGVPQSFKVTAYYNNAVFFTVSSTILQTTQFSTPPAASTLAGTSALAYKPIFLDDFSNHEKQLWFDNKATSNVTYMCWDSTNWNTPIESRLVVKSGSSLQLSHTLNVGCNIRMYLDAGTTTLITDTDVAEVDAGVGSTVYFDGGFGGSNLKSIKILPTAVADISTCPYSVGAVCPSDLVTLK